MTFSHIRDDISSQQASKKTDFIVDFIMMWLGSLRLALTSLNMTQAFHLLLGFSNYQIIYWDFKIQNSVLITKGLDNGDSDN